MCFVFLKGCRSAVAVRLDPCVIQFWRQKRTLAKVTDIIEEQEDLMGSQISYKISERSKTDFTVGNTLKNRY